MTALRVSELAARAGVPPSTVRFYERAGLLRPARRAANGYRVFDESAVDDLALIGRAKNAGMSLEDAAEVAATWRAGSCRALADRLRAHLTTELAQISVRIAELGTSRRRLEAALARLTPDGASAHGDAAPHDEPDECGPGCECDVALGARPAPDDAAAFSDTAPLPDDAALSNAAPDDAETRPPLACSLNQGELATRLDQWRALAATGSAERDGDTIRMTLTPGMLSAATTLIAAETGCCPRSRFTLEARSGQILLTAEIPGIGPELDAGLRARAVRRAAESPRSVRG